MDNRKFEDSWKDAFEGAEISPSDNVWTNIELDLEKADGGKIRRRLLFYKLLAAASVAFALGIAGVGYYAIEQKGNQGPLASNETDAGNMSAGSQEVEGTANDISTRTPPADEGRNKRSEGATSSHATAQLKIRKTDDTVTSPSALAANKPRVLEGADSGGQKTGLPTFSANTNDPSNGIAMAPGDADQYSENPEDFHAGFSAHRQLPELYSPRKPALNLKKEEPDPGVLLLARMAARERELAEEDQRSDKDKGDERLWTSVGVAAGGFSAVNSGASASSLSTGFATSNSSTVPDKQAKASGIAYSIGINVGTRLSKRWVLLGGVNYLTQSSDYVATNVVGDNNFKTLKAESINELQSDALTSSRLAPTFPYSVNNNVRFFSVPVQAGYLVLNKKLSLQLNAGVSTDLFLQNTITPEGVSLDKTTQGSGDDSPYRTVNFSGLMGTELSYKFGQRYRVAVNPGVRYPLNSVYKSDVGIQSTPLTFDVGLRFRYIFQ